MDRITRLLSTSTRKSRIIEIGASYTPTAPKAAGWNTHVVDHADQATLRAKYAPAAVDVSAIEPVDTVWRDGPLHEAVPAALVGQFDTLIVSHVIEHMPDFIGFLASAERLLGPDGMIAAALPDRRYCFDCFRPPTMTGDILQAHASGRTRHDLRTAWDHTAYAAQAGGVLGWGPWKVEPPEFIDDFAAADRLRSRFNADVAAPYVDFHAWQFTPAGFELVMLELGEMGLIDWSIATSHGPENFEFFVFLRRGVARVSDPVALQKRRMGLIRQLMIETYQQISLIVPDAELGHVMPAPPPPESIADPVVLTEIKMLLEGMDRRLRDLEATAAMTRSALAPLRALSRLFRRRR